MKKLLKVLIVLLLINLFSCSTNKEENKEEEIIDDNNAISIDIKDTVNTILISMNVPAELQKGQIMSVIKQRTKYFSIEEIADMILK